MPTDNTTTETGNKDADENSFDHEDVFETVDEDDDWSDEQLKDFPGRCSECGGVMEADVIEQRVTDRSGGRRVASEMRILDCDRCDHWICD